MQGGNKMSNKTLTKEIARELVGQAIAAKNEAFEKKYFGSSLGTLKLNDYSYIDEGAAFEVAKFDGYGITFIDLKCLSDKSAMYLSQIDNFFKAKPVLEFNNIIYIPLAGLMMFALSRRLNVTVDGEEVKVENVEKIYSKLLRKVKKLPHDENIQLILDSEIIGYNNEIRKFETEIDKVKKWKKKLTDIIKK